MKDASAPARDAASATKDARTSPSKDGASDADAMMSSETPPTVRDGAPSFCQRPGSDAIRDVFCGDTAPTIRNLRELQDAVGVHPRAPAGSDETFLPYDPLSGENGLVVLGHSTALTSRVVSPINPRAIFIGFDNIMAYQRGVQAIELASRARDRYDFNFYLLSFQKSCNDSEAGCTPGDLYTPEVEREWTAIRIEDDEDLKNTPSDCRLCHRRAREDSVLLMREIESPWTHFFEPLPDNAPPLDLPGVRGQDLVRDYLRAKGDEPYGGITHYLIRSTVGLALENVVFRAQPLFFDAPLIEDERWPYGPDGWPAEPSRSESWDRSFAAFQRGEQLPLPHYDPRPTDPAKQKRLTEAYQAYRDGTLPASELPDLADIFPDDPLLRAEIGLETTPGASPAEVLVQACGSCHNDVLDQTISRARFNIDLARLDAAEIARAIERIELPADAEGVMPPREARQIAQAAKEPLVRYLREGKRSEQDDALLSRAAKLGMMGGERPPFSSGMNPFAR